MDLRTVRAGWLTKAEWSACIGATLAAVALHAVFLTHAGGLWRDETSTVHLAQFPRFAEMWSMLGHDSFPALFPLLLRCWSAIGLGGTDFSLRFLGFLIGLFVLGTLWFNARLFGHRVPTISLGLLAVNLTLVRWGDSLRALGLGTGLMLLTVGFMWSFIQAPARGRFVAAAAAAVLSVNSLYQNAFLLFALCIAAAVVCFRCHQEKLVFPVVGVGVIAAVSLLPYAGIVAESQRWYVVEKLGFSADLVMSNLVKAVGSPQVWQILAWVAIFGLALARGFKSFGRPDRTRKIGPEDLPLFAAINIACGVFFFFFFLIVAKLPTQVWYWLPPMALVAVCADAALASWHTAREWWRTGLIALMVCVPFISGVSMAERRQTSVDLVAAHLREAAKPEDFIVVYPWYCGITFNRYYHGQTPWATLPPLSDLRLHRYDLLKDKLAATSPTQPVLDKMILALNSGNRVWLVGGLPATEGGQDDLNDLPPAPGGPWGWSDIPYIFSWGRQAERVLARYAEHIEVVPIPAAKDVNEYENIPLTLAAGLRLTR
jgi:hypothetical protein